MVILLTTSFSAWNDGNSNIGARATNSDDIVKANRSEDKTVSTPELAYNNFAWPQEEPLPDNKTETENVRKEVSNGTQPNVETNGASQNQDSLQTEAEVEAQEKPEHDHIEEDSEEAHYHYNHDPEKLTIAYNPPQIIQSPASNITLSNLDIESTVNSFGFENSSVESGNTINTDQSITVTIPEKANPAILDELEIYPNASLNVTKNGQSATINFNGLVRDENYTIGAKSKPICPQGFNEECQSEESWAYKLDFKTSVREDIFLGKSVENRDIWGYKFGRCRTNSCTKILLTGAVHGSEYLSGDLPRLIQYITDNQHEISGQDKEIYIAPNLNPDGQVRNQRYNARGVNLNRNFAAHWQPCPQCGSTYDSEPETRIARDLVYDFRPKYLISYHAQWPPYGIIFRGNDFNPTTINFANYVADRTGYPVGFFPDFDVVPGDQTVWAEERGVSSIIIEATYVTSTDWDKNFNLYLSLLRDNL